MIKQIAARARVSVSTVRRALNDFPDIGVETKAKIRRIATELNYRPNLLAQAMVTHRTMLLGVIVPELANSFFPTVIDSLETAATADGYQLLMAKHDYHEEKLAAQLAVYARYQIDGLCMVPARYELSPAVRDELAGFDKPVVFFDDEAAPASTGRRNYSWVGIDDEAAGFMAAQYLLGKGHRHLAYVGHSDTSSSAFKRCTGVRRALRQARLALPDRRVLAGNPAGGAVGAGRHLLDQGLPDAIVCMNDRVACEVMLELLTAGVKIPAEVSLLGFGNLAFSHALPVPLTTVNQFPERLGTSIFATLVSLMAGAKPGGRITMPLEILERASVAARR